MDSTVAASTAAFDWSAFANAFDNIRESRDLQWKEVAEQSGVSSSTVLRVAKGKACDVESLVKLRIWMRVPIDKFITAKEHR